MEQSKDREVAQGRCVVCPEISFTIKLFLSPRMLPTSVWSQLAYLCHIQVPVYREEGGEEVESEQCFNTEVNTNGAHHFCSIPFVRI